MRTDMWQDNQQGVQNLVYEPTLDVRTADNEWIRGILDADESYPMIPWKSYWNAYCDPSDKGFGITEGYAPITYEERCANRQQNIIKGTNLLTSHYHFLMLLTAAVCCDGLSIRYVQTIG